MTNIRNNYHIKIYIYDTILHHNDILCKKWKIKYIFANFIIYAVKLLLSAFSSRS